MNDVTNTVATDVAEELVKQIENGSAEVVEVKGNLTGKLVTGGIALGATAGAGILGWFLGRRHERKKWEDFDEDEDLDDEFDDEEDYVEYVETEPESDTKAEKTDKPEEK